MVAGFRISCCFNYRLTVPVCALQHIALADQKMSQTLRKPPFIAGAVAGLISHLLNARLGRKWCMVIAGFWFTIGAIINCAAQDLAMLYLGRILLGFGVGFANQLVSLCQSSAVSAVDLLIASTCPLTSALDQRCLTGFFV